MGTEANYDFQFDVSCSEGWELTCARQDPGCARGRRGKKIPDICDQEPQNAMAGGVMLGTANMTTTSANNISHKNDGTINRNPTRTMARPLLGSILNTSDCWPSQMSEGTRVRHSKWNSVLVRAVMGDSAPVRPARLTESSAPRLPTHLRNCTEKCFDQQTRGGRRAALCAGVVCD